MHISQTQSSQSAHLDIFIFNGSQALQSQLKTQLFNSSTLCLYPWSYATWPISVLGNYTTISLLHDPAPGHHRPTSLPIHHPLSSHTKFYYSNSPAVSEFLQTFSSHTTTTQLHSPVCSHLGHGNSPPSGPPRSFSLSLTHSSYCSREGKPTIPLHSLKLF